MTLGGYVCSRCGAWVGEAQTHACLTSQSAPLGVYDFITTCRHGVDLRFVPRCYLCRPEEPLTALCSSDHTDLLLLIAECLIPLAFKADPDGGARQSRLWEIAKAYREDTDATD